MNTPKVEEIKRQIEELEGETISLKEMSFSIDALQDKLDTNQATRTRLKKKLLDTGYKM